MGSVREDFGNFIRKGNLIQLAVAFVMGAAFTALVTALVADIFTPLIGVAGHFDFSTWTISVNGSAFLPGAFLNALITFVTIALVVFFVIALPYQRYEDRKAARAAKAAPASRECPECAATIPLKGKKCMYCGTTLTPAA